MNIIITMVKNYVNIYIYMSVKKTMYKIEYKQFENKINYHEIIIPSPFRDTTKPLLKVH